MDYAIGAVIGSIVTLIAMAVIGSCRERMRSKHYEPDIHDL